MIYAYTMSTYVLTLCRPVGHKSRGNKYPRSPFYILSDSNLPHIYSRNIARFNSYTYLDTTFNTLTFSYTNVGNSQPLQLPRGHYTICNLMKHHITVDNDTPYNSGYKHPRLPYFVVFDSHHLRRAFFGYHILDLSHFTLTSLMMRVSIIAQLLFINTTIQICQYQ